ncbi:MAG: hypothetical protein R3A10_09370 [Caldilineaceae bacterium]
MDGVTWSAVAMGDGAAAGWDWTQARWCGVTGIPLRRWRALRRQTPLRRRTPPRKWP